MKILSIPENFSSVLFVLLALSVFAICGTFYLWLALPDNYYLTPTYGSADQYDLKEIKGQDPMITPGYNLGNLLDGPIISGRDPSQGPANAPITIVEYADFECDFCHEMEIALKNIMAKHPGKIRLFWKDYPSVNKNSASYQAAKAARCAVEQGKFWDFHDLLFMDNKKLNNDLFESLGAKLDLEPRMFMSCLAESKAENAIDYNIEEANALDIAGVPFIYVNKREILGSYNEGDLEKVVSEEITKTEK